jgi:hypothetical protein
MAIVIIPILVIVVVVASNVHLTITVSLLAVGFRVFKALLFLIRKFLSVFLMVLHLDIVKLLLESFLFRWSRWILKAGLFSFWACLGIAATTSDMLVGIWLKAAMVWAKIATATGDWRWWNWSLDWAQVGSAPRTQPKSKISYLRLRWLLMSTLLASDGAALVLNIRVGTSIASLVLSAGDLLLFIDEWRAVNVYRTLAMEPLLHIVVVDWLLQATLAQARFEKVGALLANVVAVWL